jgi:hypothetical protein
MEALAVREDAAETVARPLDQGREELVRGAVDVSEACQRRPPVDARNTVQGDVVRRRIVQDDESGKVQPLELAEGHEHVLRIGHTGEPVHGRKHLP